MVVVAGAIALGLRHAARALLINLVQSIVAELAFAAVLLVVAAVFVLAAVAAGAALADALHAALVAFAGFEQS
ncbi:MAG TPA: hypothetical protein VM711_06060 [Sphingomicrobium sp.]|nr:hypothetical protein [Sphingomicrobium sp.]